MHVISEVCTFIEKEQSCKETACLIGEICARCVQWPCATWESGHCFNYEEWPYADLQVVCKSRQCRMVILSALVEELEKHFFIARQVSWFWWGGQVFTSKATCLQKHFCLYSFQREELNLSFCARQGGGKRECPLRTSSRMFLSQHIDVSFHCAVSWS